MYEYSEEIEVYISGPEEFSLAQNYPNPFNPVTKIKFSVPQNENGITSNVKLLIFDVLGKEVASLVNDKLVSGNYEMNFDGSNLPSGIYFYTLQVE